MSVFSRIGVGSSGVPFLKRPRRSTEPKRQYRKEEEGLGMGIHASEAQPV